MRSLTRDSVRDLLGAARAKGERDWLMILIAFNHGLRASEVIALTAKDLADGCVNVKRLKGSIHTIQPLRDCPEDPLFSERKATFDYVAKLNENQYLFPLTRQRFWQIVREHGKAAGIPAHLCHPHILKHSIAMQTIHSAGVENLRTWLGHKTISSTGAYLNVSDEDASFAISKALGPNPS